MVVDFRSYEVRKAGRVLEMTRKEFQVLRLLAARAGEVVTRDELLNEVWGYENYPSTRTVDNHLASLPRQARNGPGQPPSTCAPCTASVISSSTDAASGYDGTSRMMVLPRFYPILDTGALERCSLDPVVAAETLLDAGARIVQFRHKGHYTRAVFAQAGQVAALCRAAGALFVVNDRADVALLLDAALHVGQDDLTPADARRLLGSDHVLGFSTHNEEQLRAGNNEPVDYLAIGPLFATASKERPDPQVGLDALVRLRRLTSQPLVAIGGITRATAPSVLEAGADSIAVIGDLLPAIRERTEEWVKLTR